MKKIILFVFVITLFFSCKKEEQSDPDLNITYTHWYKTRSGSTDTLFSVFIPNTFSPNGDATNDHFLPLGNFTGNFFNLRVFSRDGTVVFYTSDKYFYPGWNGEIDGDRAKTGNYVYKLNISDGLGSLHEYKGQVTLFR